MIKRGASLIWAVVICSVLMLVAGTMSGFIVKESKMSVRMDDSARAYAAAESGIDWAKLCLVNKTCKVALGFTQAIEDAKTPTDVTKEYFINSAKYTVKISFGADGKYTIYSLGSSNNVNRKIEYKFEEATADIIDSDSKADDDYRILDGGLTINGSFGLRFYYWKEAVGGSASLSPGVFGVQSSSGADRIAINFDGTNFDLSVKDGTDIDVNNTTTVISSYTSPINIGTFDMSSPYAIIMDLKYLNKTSAKLTIYGYNQGTGQYQCLGTKTVYLPSASFDFSSSKFIHSINVSGGGTFTREEAKAVSPATLHPSGLNDAGNYIYKLTDGTRIGYFDNFSSTGIGFTAANNINLTVNGGGSVTKDPDKSSYLFDEPVTLTATPQSGYAFSGWGGDCAPNGTNIKCVIKMPATGGKTVTAGFELSGWIDASSLVGLYIYQVDSSDSAVWKTSNTACSAQECSSHILSSSNTVDFASYPSRNACKAVGGRLPTRSELVSIINMNNTQAHLGAFGTFSGTYWTSEEYDNTRARVVTDTGAANFWLKSQNTFKTRCVR